jgi:hypothetical protein
MNFNAPLSSSKVGSAFTIRNNIIMTVRTLALNATVQEPLSTKQDVLAIIDEVLDLLDDL